MDTEGPKPHSRLPAWLLPAGAVVLAVAVFGQVVGFSFADWDDNNNVFLNPFFHPPTAGHLAHFWTSAYYDLYMPVTYSVWWLCARVAPPAEPVPGRPDVSASVFHGTNLLFHGANVLLVWALLRLLLGRLAGGAAGREGAPRPGQGSRAQVAAAAGALLFALHPFQVESVAWVTGLNNVLGATFGLTATLLYLAGRTPGNRLARRPALAYALGTAAFVLAVLAKPTAVTVPLIVLALEWGTSPPASDAPAGPAWTGSLAPMAVWAVLGVADGVITRHSAGPTADIFLPVWGRPIVAGDAVAFYLSKFLVPVRFCVDYGRTPARVLGHWWGYADALATAAVAALLWRSRNRPLQAAGLAAVAALLPMLGFVPYYLHRWSTVGDRYAYLAMLGPAFALAWLWGFAPLRQARLGRLLGTLYAAAALLWAVQSAVQTATWRDTRTIFSQTLTVNPGSMLAKFNLGAALQREGDPDAALAVYQECVAEVPDFPPAQYEFGTVLAKLGRVDEGIAHLRKAIRLAPGYADAHNNLALALEREGKWREAVAELRAAREADPDDPARRRSLAAAEAQAARDPNARPDVAPDADPVAARENAEGVRLARAGRGDDAVLAFRRAIRERPDYAAAFYNLAVTLDRSGDLDGAAAAYRSALRRRPDYPEACLSLAVVLARQGDAAGAQARLNEALRLRPGWPAARQALASLESATRSGKTP